MKGHSSAALPLLAGFVLVGCGGAKKAVPVAPVDAATVVAAIPAELKAPATVTAGQSGWKAMSQALANVKFSNDDQNFMGNAIAAKLVDRVLQSAPEKLKAFDEGIDALEGALKEPVWQAPQRSGFDADTKLLDAQRAIVRAMCFRGRYRILSKKAGGVDDLLAALGVADRMVRSNGCLAELQTGLAHRAMAFRAIQQAAINDEFTDADLSRLAAYLQQNNEGPEVLANALKRELAEVFAVAVSKTPFGAPEGQGQDAGFAIASIQPVAEQMVGGNAKAFDRAATMTDAAPLLTALTGNASLPWSQQKPTEPIVADLSKGWPADLFARRETFSGDEISQAQTALGSVTNPFGKFLLALVSPSWIGLGQTWVSMQSNRNASRIILAAAAYRHSHGASLPTDLAQLNLPAPSPVDPFASAPFHYDASAKRFWSVGPNGKDDGGKDRPGFFLGGKDMVYLMPGAEGYN